MFGDAGTNRVDVPIEFIQGRRLIRVELAQGGTGQVEGNNSQNHRQTRNDPKLVFGDLRHEFFQLIHSSFSQGRP